MYIHKYKKIINNIILIYYNCLNVTFTLITGSIFLHSHKSNYFLLDKTNFLIISKYMSKMKSKICLLNF